MTDLNQLMVELLQEWIENPPDEDARDAFYSAMKVEGWTPPAEKEPEPEFKEGEAVDFSNSGHTWLLSRYARKNGDKHKDERGVSWKYCRHPESWLKPESGPSPDISLSRTTNVLVKKTKEGKYWVLHNGKWYWLPLD